jgi:glycosyltransferase involved in cell wall biosynthesis
MRQRARQSTPAWRRLLQLLSLPLLPLRAAERHLLHLESTFGWWISAAAVGLWQTGRRHYDPVYSTGGSPSAHAAAAVIARFRRLPWIAEMQDPLVYQGLGRGFLSESTVRRLERTVHTRATGVVYVTRGAREAAARRSGDQVPSVAIYPGAEPLPTSAPQGRGAEMRLVHIGSLTRKRTPETLLAALGELAERRPEVRREVRLSLMGPAGSYVRNLVEEFPYPEMVQLPGRAPHQVALGAAAAADLLLLIQHYSSVSQDTIPSKTYEYLLSGRAILALTYRNPELAGMLSAAGHTCVEVDNVPGIARALEASYDEWRVGSLCAAPCHRYTVASAVRELVTWTRQVRSAAGVTRNPEREAVS